MKYDLELITDDKNALSIILKQIQTNSVVLEFGPANGRMTKYLKEVLGCTVYIVEIDGVAAQDAIKYAKDGLIDDIENYVWVQKWEKIEFDYVVFADVLEHLRNPQEVLSRTKRLLKDDGKVIISVPNISHNSVMINLYNNIFNYTPLGLLDNTHIHFFAYNTLKVFCHNAGYIPITEDATYSEVGANEILNSFNDVDQDIAYNLKKRNYGNVYQFIFTLQKEEYTKINSCVTDYRIKKTIPIEEVKVYLDRGNGFCEENCVTYHMNVQNGFVKEISLENCEEIKAIRIDPLNMSGIFKFNKIQVVDKERTETWETKDCKCRGVFFGEYLFADDDPQLIIDVDHLKSPAKLYIDIEYKWIYADENALKVCLDIVNQHIGNIDQIETLNRELKEKNDVLRNDIRLLNEELDRRAVELDHRMDEINIRDKEIDRQRNELKVANEQVYQHQNEIKLLNEELDRRAMELGHRMDEIHLRDSELDKRAIELDHRMDEINIRDYKIDEQKNELKLSLEELDRRAVELDHRMDKINELQAKLDYLESLSLNGVMKWYFNKER